ncbi:MAG: universal stress protein [Syntrophaceae bacterium]|nr:universal stress protein [Syntrophaceae bacterium]
MFKRILAAVDGSHSSLHALRQAISIARAEKGVIKVVSVAPPYTGDLRLVGVRENVNDMILAPHKKALEEALRIASLNDIHIRSILEIGEPAEKIVETAEELNCDLIVVGIQGGNPARNAIMGSTAARVIGLSSVYVLAVPMNSEVDLDRIIVAVDGSKSSERATAVAFQLQRSYGSGIVVLSVADIPSHLYGLDANVAENMLKEAREVLEPVQFKSIQHGVQIEPLLREGAPADMINQTAVEKRIGLIIIGSHGRTGLKRLLMGSVAESVIVHAPCPVLITR